MYNSINHFIEFGVKNIEKRVKDFVSNGGDLADLILNLKEDVFELIRNILQEVIEDMDDLLRNNEGETITADVVGNICESGDILAKERTIFMPQEKDIIGVMDAGAYGYSMSSNYNNRLRPAEVLIRSDGSVQLIRRRDTLEDLIRNF
jgi:diaminopimelate decarboxylase